MYDFINYSQYPKEDLPQFARIVFSSPTISEESKKKLQN